MPKLAEKLIEYEIKITSLQKIEYLLKDVSTFFSSLDIEKDKKKELGQKILEAIMPIIYEVIELTTKAAPTTNFCPIIMKKESEEVVACETGQPK